MNAAELIAYADHFFLIILNYVYCWILFYELEKYSTKMGITYQAGIIQRYDKSNSPQGQRSVVFYSWPLVLIQDFT